LMLIAPLCADTSRNQICYGKKLVKVDYASVVNSRFETPGDIMPLSAISRLVTTAFDAKTGDWGLAIMTAQVNLPDTLPGQNVTFLIMGDAQITDAAEAQNPMQAFYFRTGPGQLTCTAAPDAIIIQGPSQSTVSFTVNGVDVTMGSTLVLTTPQPDLMQMTLVSGSAEITAGGETRQLAAGQVVTVPLDDATLPGAKGLPGEASPYDPDSIEYLPFQLLPNMSLVRSDQPWTDTGTTLEKGQTFTVIAAGHMNTCFGQNFPVCVFNAPQGKVGSTSCQSGACLLYGAPYGLLVGRIGGGTPFAVGAGGTFTASNSGTLELGINDAGWDDNAGFFTALITLASA